jgi:protein required for attachment to host cells
MKTLWILNGNRGFAKIFEVQGHGRIVKEIFHLDNPNGLKKSGEILADRPGRAFDRMGGARHALSTETSVEDHEQQLFAHQLSKILQEGHDRQAFDELALVAPTHFIGAMNTALHETVRKKIVKEVGKDLPLYVNTQERIDQLCGYLDLWNRNGA